MFELGEAVRPSESYLAASNRHTWLEAHSVGRVTGYASPKLFRGERIGAVDVLWEDTGQTTTLRWDQLERAYG